MEVVTQIAPPRERQAPRATLAARIEQVPALADMLGRAFVDDPLIRFIEPDDAWRKKLTPVLYGAVLRYCLRYGQADITSDASAVACWLLPSHCQPSLARELRSGMWALPFRAKTSALRRLLRFDALSKALRKEFGGAAHWYLWSLAVDPAQQRKGHASTLLRSVLTRADRSGEVCYLETQNPNNVPIYQRYGFALAARAELAPGVIIHAMRREPQAPQMPSRRTSA